MSNLPQDIWLRLSIDHLGIGEFHGMSQLSHFFCRMIVPLRSRFLLQLRRYLVKKLREWTGFDEGILSLLSKSSNVVIAGSSLLSIVNKEYWTPNDVDIWFEEKDRNGPYETDLTRQLMEKAPLSGLSHAFKNNYPRQMFRFGQIISRKLVRTGCSIPINLLMVIQQNTHESKNKSKSKSKSKSWGRRVVESFDAEFLQMYFDGKTLAIEKLQSLVDRASPLLDRSDSDMDHRQIRQTDRFNLYRSRNYFIGRVVDVDFRLLQKWIWNGRQFELGRIKDYRNDATDGYLVFENYNFFVTGEEHTGFFDLDYLDFSLSLSTRSAPRFRNKSNFASLKNEWRLFFLDSLRCSALVELLIAFLHMEVNVFEKELQCETR